MSRNFQGSFTGEVNVDDMIHQSSNNEDETQGLLSVERMAQEHQDLRTFVASLQAQVERLEQGMLPGSTTRDGEPPKEQATSTKNVSFSHIQSQHETEEEDDEEDQDITISQDDNSGVEGSQQTPSPSFISSTRSATRVRNKRKTPAPNGLNRFQKPRFSNPTKTNLYAAANTTSILQSSNYNYDSNNNLVQGDGGGEELVLQTLHEDTVTLLFGAPTCSPPFFLAIFVLLFQLAIFTLMATNLLQVEDYGFNLFGIPANVTEGVWIAQIIAIIIAVVTQDGIRTGLDMLREGYGPSLQAACPYSNTWKFAFSIATRLLEGSLGVTVNFLLIVTSETVIDLLLNFTALAFVSQLGSATFFLCKQGFAGKTCLEHSVRLSEVEYPVPRAMVQARKTIMMVFVLVIMMISWGVVRYNQTTGQYLCGTLLIQFGGDETRPELPTFSGLYDLEAPSRFGFRSHHVQYVDRHAHRTRFAFCESEKYWTVQWYDSYTVPWNDDPCTDFYARSSETDTFDVTRTLTEGDWYVLDELNREVILEPFFLHCFDCGNNLNGMSQQDCSGRGTCSDAICSCDEGWYGLRCEFQEPCPQLALDARTNGFQRLDPLRENESKLNILYYNDKADNNNPVQIDVYHRPVYIGHYTLGNYDVMFYTGRRWAHTHTGLMPLNITGITSEKDAQQEVARFFFNDFHAHWSSFSVEFLSEPLDFGTPSDANAPVDAQFFAARLKQHPNQTEIQSANEARLTDALFICATCDANDNPCRFDGVCNDGTCQCSIGAEGSRCEKSPVENGRCDLYYNEPEFELDGGDCCDSTCVSTAEFACGEDLDGYTNMGYFHCKLPDNRWQLVGGSIGGDPMSLAGFSVALSHAGTILAVGEPNQSRVNVFDKDGATWILREVIQGSPDSQFGLSVALSGGRVHWRNNPGFRAPLILAVGMKADNAPPTVEVYSCGFGQRCQRKDTFVDVHGNKGPEAFDIARGGRMMALGFATSSIDIYELSEDYYLGRKELRSSFGPSSNLTSQDPYGVKLSGKGDHLVASFGGLETNAVQAASWNGASYVSRGEVLLETKSRIYQRQLAISGNGNVVAVGVSECAAGPHQIGIFVWEANNQAWSQRGSPPLPERICTSSHASWSVALSEDGTTLSVAAYPESDVVVAYYWNEKEWNMIGEPIQGAFSGGIESSLAMSSNGAHLVRGMPFAGLNEAGIVSSYSIPHSQCPANSSHHFRLSLTTDYEPEKSFWTLETMASGSIVTQGGPYGYPLATLVEELCLDTALCHFFTIYSITKQGLDPPARFDLFLDGKDVDRDSFRAGFAKRVSVGAGCSSCPSGTRRFRTMVQACETAEWKLLSSNGNTIVSGESSDSQLCDSFYHVENFYWEDVCVDENACYTFTVTPYNDELGTPRHGFNYLLLYDNDVHVASNDQLVLESVSVKVGNCPAV